MLFKRITFFILPLFSYPYYKLYGKALYRIITIREVILRFILKFFLVFNFLILPAESRSYVQPPHQEVMGDRTILPRGPIKVCWGWSCKKSKEVLLKKEDWNFIESHFSPSLVSSPREERMQIQTVIGLFEEIIGGLTGTGEDIGGDNSRGIGRPGQMDCVDESTNTANYLLNLQALKLFKYHRVAHIETRLNRPFLFFLGQHYTATIQEIRTGAKFTVDSWWFDNGTPPVIQNLKRWKRRKSFNPDYVP